MEEFRFWHYDGQSAVRRSVILRPIGDGFIAEEPETGWSGDPVRWDRLTVIGREGDRSAYGHSERPGWRIGFIGQAPHAIARHLPQPERYGRWIDRFGFWPAAAAFTVVAAAVVFIVLQVPDWLAPLIPRHWEERMGDAMVGDFGGRFCQTPAGDAALIALVRKVDPQGEARDVSLANIPLVNAVTLPGGRIILFDGLIQQATSPDEVAGVLGHELGHVRHRDTLTGLLRQLGLTAVLGSFGGNAGGYLNGVLALSYGRKAETSADGVAIEQMRAANISPLPTAGFFARLSGDEGSDTGAQAMTWLSSHPLSAERRKRFEAAAAKGQNYRPVLDVAQWQALRGSCKADPDVAKPWGRGT